MFYVAHQPDIINLIGRLDDNPFTQRGAKLVGDFISVCLLIFVLHVIFDVGYIAV